MDGLTYWWKKHQNLKTILKEYMKNNKIASVEEAIKQLLRSK